MKSGKIKLIRTLVETHGWDLARTCHYLDYPLGVTRNELRETEEGRELLAEIERRRPRSGLNIGPKYTLRGMPAEVQAAQKEHAAGKGESWSAWVLRVTEAARARGE